MVAGAGGGGGGAGGATAAPLRPPSCAAGYTSPCSGPCRLPPTLQCPRRPLLTAFVPPPHGTRQVNPKDGKSYQRQLMWHPRCGGARLELRVRRRTLGAPLLLPPDPQTPPPCPTPTHPDPSPHPIRDHVQQITTKPGPTPGSALGASWYIAELFAAKKAGGFGAPGLGEFEGGSCCADCRLQVGAERWPCRGCQRASPARSITPLAPPPPPPRAHPGRPRGTSARTTPAGGRARCEGGPARRVWSVKPAQRMGSGRAAHPNPAHPPHQPHSDPAP
jgi:hypothetical protein